MKPTDVSQFPENGMSTTPRTDAAYFKQGATMYDLAGESKKLETELAAMTARAEKAEADTARLDWLEKRGPWDSWNGFGEQGVTLTTSNVRAAIDLAMKEASK